MGTMGQMIYFLTVRLLQSFFNIQKWSLNKSGFKTISLNWQLSDMIPNAFI